ncbi:lamin tail domain-containing protein [Kallotenue papyrolyticum]|uniref:lamin tail domain-containing protein n=1 Tax=Kallotenue papyrolyticum TaxID=1325125 RepID=UPI0004922A02|nr:lamin tail domain-containing protein [Kallotenue papyrolyticum]
MQRRTLSTPLHLPALGRLRSADVILPLMLALAVALPLVLALLGVGIRRDRGTPLVINEALPVPAPGATGAWVELYNNTDAPISIDGWRLGSVSGDVALLSGSVAPHSYRLIETPAAWNAQADAVVLRTPDGSVVDRLNWGPRPSANTSPDWNSSATRAPAPGRALVRNPQGFDSDSGKDWLATQPSPGAPSPASLSVGMYRLLFDMTNYASLIGGFILWGAYSLIGLIARRFELLTGQRTYWISMLIAPIGIVIYNVIQSYAFFTAGRMTQCDNGWSLSACQQGWAFTALFVSGVAMGLVVYRFYRIARRILEV